MIVQINKLYGLENISDCYYLNNDFMVVNINTGKIKTISINHKGYAYVSLNEKFTNIQIKVFMHKIVALACINNGPYNQINHKDGNKLHNHPDNLNFCTAKENIDHAFNTGLIYREEKIFKIKYNNSLESVGTIKQLSESEQILKGTLYDLYYKNKGSKLYNISSIEKIS